jgi:tetratricopeptide (TPR) repeat protein
MSSGLGRRLLSSLRDALNSISQAAVQLDASPLAGVTILADQLAQARTALGEGKAQEVVDSLETVLDRLVLLVSATSATLGSAYDQLGRGRDKERAFRLATVLFRRSRVQPAPAEIVAIVPALNARGKGTEAIEALRAVAAKYPDDIPVALLLADELAAAGDSTAGLAYADVARRLGTGYPAERVRYLKRATELDVGNAEFRARLGEALLRAGDALAAMAELQAAIPHLPMGHEANLWLAEATSASGHPEEALKIIDRILTDDENNVAALVVRADAHIRLRELGAAMTDLNHAVVLDPRGLPAQRKRADVLAQLGRYEESIEACDVVLAAAPNDRQTLMSRARARYASRHLEASATDFAATAKLAESAGDKELLARALSWHGETLRLLGRYDEALAGLERAEAAGPPSAFLQGTKGQVLTILGRRDEAAKALTAALAADPRLTWVHSALAEVYRLDGQLDKALEELEMGGREGQSAYEHFTRGQVLAALGRNREAADELRKTWALDPSVAVAYELAVTLATLGNAANLEESLAVVDQALSAQPGTPSLLARRADTLRILGRAAEALVAVDQSLAVSDDADNRGLKALILADLGRMSEALELADALLAQDPGIASARYAKIQVHADSHEYDEALSEIDALLRDVPGDLSGIMIKGSILCDIGRYTEAVALLDPLVRKHSGQPLLSALAGYALRRQEPADLEGSAEYLGRAVQEDPSDTWYQVELADTLDDLDRGAEAREIRQQVVDHKRTGRSVTARSLGDVGWAALFIGRPEEGAALLGESVQLDPKDLHARFALALALLHAGKKELAMDEYASAISLTEAEKSPEYRRAVLREALTDLGRARDRGRLDAEQLSAAEAESRLRAALQPKA